MNRLNELIKYFMMIMPQLHINILLVNLSINEYIQIKYDHY